MVEGHDERAKQLDRCICHIDQLFYLISLEGGSDVLLEICH